MTATESTLDTLIHRFARAAERLSEAIDALDETAANRQSAILTALNESIRKQGAAGTAKLQSLLEHPSASVAATAALYLLDQKPDLAEAVLERVAKTEGMLGFRAQVALERWRASQC